MLILYGDFATMKSLYLALFAVRNFYIAPTTINHMTLCQHAHLRFVARKPNEPESLGLSCFYVFLNLKETLYKCAWIAHNYLCHQDFTIRLKILSKFLFSCLPRES